MAALLHWVFSAIISVIFIISHRFYHVRTHGHKKCQGNFCHPSLAEQWQCSAGSGAQGGSQGRSFWRGRGMWEFAGAGRKVCFVGTEGMEEQLAHSQSLFEHCRIRTWIVRKKCPKCIGSPVVAAVLSSALIILLLLLAPAPLLPATAQMTQITESSVQPSPAQPSPAQHSHYAPGPGHFYNSNFWVIYCTEPEHRISSAGDQRGPRHQLEIYSGPREDIKHFLLTLGWQWE